jgi:hypothetical protein
MSQDEDLDSDGPAEIELPNGGTAPRATKAKLLKTIPTDRVSFERQLEVLRAYAAASGPEKKAVTNEEVAAVLKGLAPSSVSICNPFFGDSGALVTEGRKQRPTDAVFDYLHAYEWNPETAGLKLHGIFAQTWAAKALLPKLSFRPLTKDEAAGFLAEESKAQKSHRKSLDTLLEFLATAGVVKIDGNTVTKSQPNGIVPPPVDAPPTDNKPPRSSQGAHDDAPPPADVERFTIPIPGKQAAIISVPKDLEADDWDMLSVMIETYIKRLRRDSIKGNSS